MQIPLSLATPQFNPISPSRKKLPSYLLESSPSNISTDTPYTRDRVSSYTNNSNDIFQSGVIFEKLKVSKLKKELLDELRIDIKVIISYQKKQNLFILIQRIDTKVIISYQKKQNLFILIRHVPQQTALLKLDYLKGN